MAYDAATGTIVLFGGIGFIRINDIGNLGDTWTWDGTTWTKQAPATSPSARYEPSMAYDTAASHTVLFGGGGKILFSDTWTWGG
jgi:hypothetical protein